jgi:small nuclear ribonucleoprotein (snRNP)-like protein
MSIKEKVKTEIIDKIVRVSVSDGRLFVGRLHCIDKTKAVFLLDALEIIDKDGSDFMEHDIFNSNMLKGDQEWRQVHRMMGSVVIPVKHVKKIELDKILS